MRCKSTRVEGGGGRPRSTTTIFFHPPPFLDKETKSGPGKFYSTLLPIVKSQGFLTRESPSESVRQQQTCPILQGFVPHLMSLLASFLLSLSHGPVLSSFIPTVNAQFVVLLAAATGERPIHLHLGDQVITVRCGHHLAGHEALVGVEEEVSK